MYMTEHVPTFTITLGGSCALWLLVAIYITIMYIIIMYIIIMFMYMYMNLCIYMYIYNMRELHV